MKICGIITVIVMLFCCFDVNATEINREISKEIEVKTEEEVCQLVDEMNARIEKDLANRVERFMSENLES